MDGLECKEVDLLEILNNKDKRIDSTFYTAKIPYNHNLTYVKIGQYLVSTQYGVSKDMSEEHIGYPIYRMNEIHHMLCDLNPTKSVELSNKEFEKFKLNNRDVLFNRTNSYEFVGRTGIYYYNGVDQTYASYLVRLNPDNENILSEYLAAFLNSKYGVADVKRRARQSINQTNVNPEEVKEIKIPLICNSLQKLIKECFLKANQLRISATDEYAMAESILSHSFDLSSQNENAITFSIKTLENSFFSTGRLDAEYYQPKYDQVFDILKNFPTKTLGGKNGIVTIKKSIEPGSNAYCENGIPFVRISDVTKFGISEPSIKLPSDIVPNVSSLYPHKNTILFSKDGSVGIAYKVEEDSELITSGALLHLTVKNTEEILPDYLTLILNSKVVQLQAERDSNGAVIQHWKPSEIENVVIPLLDMDIQRDIASKVQEAFRLREKSKQLLEYAKQAVEMAIEQNEDVAIKWLDEKVKYNGDK